MACTGEQAEPGEDEPGSDAEAESDDEERQQRLARSGGGGGARAGTAGRAGGADAPGGGVEKVPEVQVRRQPRLGRAGRV